MEGSKGTGEKEGGGGGVPVITCSLELKFRV